LGATPPIIKKKKIVIAASGFTYAIAAATGNQKRM
jgi:hypothetical protein